MQKKLRFGAIQGIGPSPPLLLLPLLDPPAC